MGKAVKHSAKLRRKSLGTIFKKRVFRSIYQNTPVPKACSSQIQVTNISNREDNEYVLSASARKLQSLNKMNTSTTTTDDDDNDGCNSYVDQNLPSCYLLVNSDILKSIVTIIGTCPECTNRLEIKKRGDFHCV